MQAQQDKTLNPLTELPPMSWARHFICPHGHFYDHEGHAYGWDWTATWCNECDKEFYGGVKSSAFYSRQEWNQGADKLLAVATSLNQKFLGKPAHCQICNKPIKAVNDKAFHLQKHFRKAIAEADLHFIVELK